MESKDDKLKSWGFFLAGLGIFLIGIAALITVIRCPARSKFMDFFRPPCSSTVTKTVYSSGAPYSMPITSSREKKFDDEEFEQFYEEYKKGLAEQKIPKPFLESLCSKETKEKMRRAFKEASTETKIHSLRIEKKED